MRECAFSHVFSRFCKKRFLAFCRRGKRREESLHVTKRLITHNAPWNAIRRYFRAGPASITPWVKNGRFSARYWEPLALIATGGSCAFDKAELMYLFTSNRQTRGFWVATRLDCRSISTPMMKRRSQTLFALGSRRRWWPGVHLLDFSIS